MAIKTSAEYMVATARAFAGAIIFGFPMLMTMEMWWLGFHMDPPRLLLFLVLAVPALTKLCYYAGFEPTFRWRDDVIDAFTALGVGAVASAIMLGLFGVLNGGHRLVDIVGMVAVQTVPASIGAVLARKQLGGERSSEERKKGEASYLDALFLMAMGALFVAFNVAPTEEMILIAYKMTPFHGLALIVVSIAMLHVFVYTIGFHGQEASGECSFPRLLFSYSVAGYGVGLLVSLYVLWTFGRTDGVGLVELVMPTVVLGFPAALGAATARLIL